MVIKSDQTVVENFHLYTNNLDIQAVGISIIVYVCVCEPQKNGLR